MKRLILIVVLLGVGGLIAFLAVTRNMAQQRATKLDKALIQAEGKIMELEGDMQSLEQDLQELKSKTSAAPSTPSSTTTGSTNAATPSSSAAPATQTTTATSSDAALVRFAAAGGPGLTNLVRIEGTSSVHDWRVVSSLIGGSAEFPQNLLVGAAAGAAIPAKASTFIPVRSLKSIKADGSPYSDAMDEILYEKLLVQEHPRITFTLNSLKAIDSANLEASGQLGVAGKTNTVTMPITVNALNDGRMQVSGTVKTKMTDFGIEPPAPGPIRTGDEVTLKFVWSIKPVTAQPAAK